MILQLRLPCRCRGSCSIEGRSRRRPWKLASTTAGMSCLSRLLGGRSPPNKRHEHRQISGPRMPASSLARSASSFRHQSVAKPTDCDTELPIFNTTDHNKKALGVDTEVLSVIVRLPFYSEWDVFGAGSATPQLWCRRPRRCGSWHRG